MKTIVSILFSLIVIHASSQKLIINKYDSSFDAIKRETTWEPFVLNDSVKIYVAVTKYVGRDKSDDMLILHAKISLTSGAFSVTSSNTLPFAVEIAKRSFLSIPHTLEVVSCKGCGSINGDKKVEGIELDMVLDDSEEPNLDTSAVTKMRFFFTNSQNHYDFIEEEVLGKSQTIIKNELKLVQNLSKPFAFPKNTKKVYYINSEKQ